MVWELQEIKLEFLHHKRKLFFWFKNRNMNSAADLNRGSIKLNLSRPLRATN